MGLFDTVHFPKPVMCLACEMQISSTQTKAFDPLQNDFYIGDCVGHAEEIRIVREALHCDACHAYDRQFVYLVVYRGILIDIVADLATAEAQLQSFSFERLVFWYHALFAKYNDERSERHALTVFLGDVLRWFEGKYDQMSPEELDKQWVFFLQNRAILELAENPLVAIRAYLKQIKLDGAEVERSENG